MLVFSQYSGFLRRFDEVKEGLHFSKWMTGSLEVLVVLLFTFFVLRVCSLGGRRFFQIAATLITLISVAASYYMTAFNVVIGYGIIISVFSPGDLGLFSEVVGWKFLLWFIAASIIPLAIIWLGSGRNTLLEQLKTPGKRISSLAVMAAIVAVVWVPLNMMGTAQKKIDQKNNVDMPSYGGVVAHSYLPSNWLAAFGLYAYTALDERQDEADLLILQRSLPMLRLRGLTILISYSSLAKLPVGTTWAFLAMSAILRLSWRKSLIWLRSAESLVILRPSFRYAACLCGKAALRIMLSAR